MYWPDRTACCSEATLKAREDVSKAASVRACTEDALEAKLMVSSVGTCCVLVGAVLLLVVSATLLDIDRVDSVVDGPYALMFKDVSSSSYGYYRHMENFCSVWGQIMPHCAPEVVEPRL